MNNLSRGLKNWLGLPKSQLDLYQITWLLAPIFTWFSFHPVIGLGADSTMNFELSLALIYVVFLAVIGLPKIWSARQKLYRNHAVWLVGAFVCWQFLTLLWTANLTRGVLTCGIFVLLFLIFLAAIAARKSLKKILSGLIKILIISAIVMSILALIQIVAGIWLGRDETLLCAGCVAQQFGFVRPNVFAIEPQFFGSMLLAPLLILQHLILKRRKDWRYNLAFGFLFMTLVLTLSRGAIFAFGLGALILFIINWQSWKRILGVVGLTIAGFSLALIIQGSAAVANPNFNENFSPVVAKSIHQLSLGVIDLRQSETAAPAETIETDEIAESATSFDGYVPESTDTRVNLSRIALETWLQNPPRVLVGAGLGGAGVAMAEFSSGQGQREIVQNEYVEILLERGLVGAGIFMAMIVGLFMVSRRQKWTWAIIAAFLFQWIFFSGPANALHIYLTLILVFVLAKETIYRRVRSESAKTS